MDIIEHVVQSNADMHSACIDVLLKMQITLNVSQI